MHDRDRAPAPRGSKTDCCDSVLIDRLDRARAEQVALLLKAVADPVRLQLLNAIRAAAGQEACVCDLTEHVGLSQPTVSHHLRVLSDAGLIHRERRGNWAWYSIVAPRLAEVAAIFSLTADPSREMK